MHNQDTAKDDVMEAMFEIIRKLSDYYKRPEKQVENAEEIETKQELEQEEINIDDQRINKFQKAMKSIIKSEANDQVKKIAQTFYENPKDSMKMLQSVISDQAREEAKELATLTNESINHLKEIKSKIDMTDPKALDQLTFINILEEKEKRKSDLALSVLSEMNPLEKETLKKPEQSLKLERREMEEALKRYFETLDPDEKKEYEFAGTRFDEKSNVLTAVYHNIKDRGYSDKRIELNVNNGIAQEIDETTTEERNQWVKEESVTNEFYIKDFLNDNTQSKENDDLEPER
ncbi:hypothetical protein [Bacillus subtilis]|uniref:hypothetical protein n=1 Tax=Bacillus subtilis TaxID=1423 RepID=UPI001BA429CB|nr:hypothetical protein [Bacillus subtilis]CAI6330547.1 hypothetical protein NRS6096_21825 [Bacillus subtilis]